MKAILKRNLPVLVLGVAALIVFVTLIVLERNKNEPNLSMEQLTENELIAGHTYITGLPQAPISVVAFLDLEDYNNLEVYKILKELKEANKDLLQYAIRFYPTTETAKQMSLEAQAAGEQNKFWDYLDALTTGATFDKTSLEATATDAIKTMIDTDIKDAKALGIKTPPLIYVNKAKYTFTTPLVFKNVLLEQIRNLLLKTAKPQTTESTTSNKLIPTAPQIKESIEITYTDKGFDPKYLTVDMGQKVIWVNSTEEDIFIEQLDKKFAEFGEPVLILAGESFEFIPYKDSMWRYQEKTTKNWGSIYIRQN